MALFMKSSIFIFGLVLSVSRIQAQSFDCSKAITDVEKTICQSSELKRLDAQMVRLFRRVIKNQSVLRRTGNYLVYRPVFKT